MRAEADQFDQFLPSLPVDQHKIGFEVAIPEIPPFARQSMVAVLLRQWSVVYQQSKDCAEFPCKAGPVLALRDALEILFEF